MESRVIQTLCMLIGVLVMVYRAFFRSLDDVVSVGSLQNTFSTSSYNSEAMNNSLLPADPFRDSPSDFPIAVDTTRVQVLSEKNALGGSPVSPTVIPQPVVVDGLKFHATTDLFDGNDNKGAVLDNSSIPGMYLWQGQQKILSYLGLASTAKIIYKDVHNTHFCLLSTFDLNQWKLVIQKLGGSFLAIPLQIDRNNRGLFGDNAYLLTIPKYRTTKMIALIQYRNDWRYVQVDKDRYDGAGKNFVKNNLPLYYSK